MKRIIYLMLGMLAILSLAANAQTVKMLGKPSEQLISKQTDNQMQSFKMAPGTIIPHNGLEVKGNNEESNENNASHFNRQYASAQAPTVTNASPKPATNLNIKDFTLGNPDGKFCFTLPSQTVAGSNLNGNLMYLITVKAANQSNTFSGVGQPGQDIEAEITLPVVGKYTTFSVTVYTLDGDASELSSISLWMKEGRPELPALPVLRKIDLTTLHLSWDKPIASANGLGIFIDEDKITFSITRSDGVLIADSIKDLEVTDHIDVSENISICYNVKINYKNQSFVKSSNFMPLGDPIDLPFENVHFNKYGTDYAEGYNFTNTIWDLGTTASLKLGTAPEGTIITPPINLDRGAYKLTWEIRTQDDVFDRYSSLLAVHCGDGLVPDSLTSVIVDTMLVHTSNNWVRYTSYFGVFEPGVQHVGFWLGETESSYYTYLRNISIEPYENVEAPRWCDNFNVQPASPGANEAIITLNAPTTSMMGEPTTLPLTKIEIYRGDELIYTFDSPEAGATLNCSDVDVPNGNIVYWAYAYNSAGKSVPVWASAFFGLDRPTYPNNVDIKIEGNNVTLSWDPVTTGENGQYVGKVTYDIINQENNEVLVNGIVGTSYTFEKMDLSGDARWLYYWIGAENSMGHSQSVSRCPVVVIGDASELPYRESFPNGQQAISGFLGTMGAFGSINDADDANGDDGYIYCYDQSQIHLRPMNFSGTANPVLSFYVRFANDGHPLQPYFIDGMTGEWQPIGEVIDKNSFNNANTWNKVELPLTTAMNCEWGRIVFVNDNSEIGYITKVLLDDIRVYDLVNSISVSMTAPACLKDSDSGIVRVNITNDGPETVAADAFQVDIYKNQERIVTTSLHALAQDESMSFEFDVNPSKFEDDVVCRAVVSYGDDQKPDDNEVESVIRILHSPLPNILELSGSVNSNVVDLGWNEPNHSGNLLVDIVEDCENYEAGANGGLTRTNVMGNIGEWTVVNHPVAGYVWPDGVEQILVDNGEDQWYEYTYHYNSWHVRTGLAHSGDKYFGSRAIYTNDQDFITGVHALVSPKLSGNDNVISFWTRARNDINSSVEYNNTFALYVGWSDAESLDDYFNSVVFQKVDQFKVSQWKWEKKTYALPTEANYFVILDVNDDSNNNYGGAPPVMLDDITYTAVVDTTLTLLGYNVYRDGALLAELRTEGNGAKFNVYRDGALMAENVPAANYIDEPEEDGVYTYQVTAVYAEGESAPSNKVRIVFVKDTPTGVSDIDSGRRVVSRRYVNPAGMVSDTPFDGVNIVVTTLDDGTTRTTKVVR